MKKLFIMLLIGLILSGTAVSCKEKEEINNRDKVVEYIYDTYYSNTNLKKSAYEFQTLWKNNELECVIEHHTEGGKHYIALFDKDLNLVVGKAGDEYDDITKSIYDIIEGL